MNSYECGWCDEKFPTLKGVRMHGGYAHKADIMEGLVLFAETYPGRTAPEIGRVFNMEPHHLSNKYLSELLKAKRIHLGKPRDHWNTYYGVAQAEPKAKPAPKQVNHRYKCSECDRSFTTKRGRGNHKRWHRKQLMLVEPGHFKYDVPDNPPAELQGTWVKQENTTTGPVPQYKPELDKTVFLYRKVGRLQCLKGVFTGKVRV